MSNMVLRKRTQWGVGLFAAMVAVIGLVAPVFAAETSGQSISQGFKAEDPLGVGTLVSYADDVTKLSVKAANTNTADRLVGVAGERALVELSDGTTQTQVVTNGSTLALVSDINGAVNAGDKVTISPIKGVGMKAVESGTIVGTALEPFSSAQDIHEVQVQNRSGETQTVKVGLIPVQVAVTYYKQEDKNKSILPEFLLRIAQAVSGGREVSVMRVIVALVVLMVGVIVIGVLVYTSVTSSIVSIGRNPLAAKSINRSLFEVAGMAVGILLIMLIAVYLILVT